MQEGHWNREDGDISKATSRATLSPGPGRHWQHTGAEKLTWQLGQVCGNPLSRSHLRVKWQGSDPRTPTLYPSLHHRASYSNEIFSHLGLPDCLFSSSFPHSKIPFFSLSSAFPAQVLLPAHDTLTLHHLPIHPLTSNICPCGKSNPHLHTCTSGFGAPGYKLHQWKRSWGQKKKRNVNKKVDIW